MQFTDRKKFFTDRLSLLRSVRSVRIDKPYMTSLAMKIVSPTKRCSSERTVKRFFTDRISLLRSARSVRIGKPCMTSNEMQFTDPISLLRSVRSVRIDKPYMSTLAMKIFPTNEMQFTDRKRPFTDCMPYLNRCGPYGS